MNQCDLILKHLQNDGKITSFEAFEKYRITRLSGRIYDLKAKGYDITTNLVTNKNTTYAEYLLNEEKNNIIC